MNYCALILFNRALVKLRLNLKQKGGIINHFLSILAASPRHSREPTENSDLLRRLHPVVILLVLLALNQLKLRMGSLDYYESIVHSITSFVEVCTFEPVSRPSVHQFHFFLACQFFEDELSLAGFLQNH